MAKNIDKDTLKELGKKIVNNKTFRKAVAGSMIAAGSLTVSNHMGQNDGMESQRDDFKDGYNTLKYSLEMPELSTKELDVYTHNCDTFESILPDFCKFIAYCEGFNEKPFSDGETMTQYYGATEDRDGNPITENHR